MMARIVKWVKGFGAFSAGMFIGVCYGSAVSAVTCFVILS